MTAFADHSPLLDLLWACQDAHGYVSDEDILSVAAQLGLSAIEVEGVCTFYHFFHRKPAGKYTIYLNDSILSRCKGYDEVRQAFEKATAAPWGGVDRTGTFGLYDTSCIGLSDQEPAALINFHPFVQLTPEKVAAIIAGIRAGTPLHVLADTFETSLYYPPNERAVLFREMVPGKSLERLHALHPEEVLAEVHAAGLRGLGGAFFPVGEKWRLCRAQPAPTRYVVCNADEGEPGTFKDRVLLTRRPELLIEGMISAGYAIGAAQGIIYLRAEYRYLKPMLEDTLDRYRRMGWLGRGIPALLPFDFDIRIQIGAGAYICGEETALLDSLMGKRGEPWTKVFFPVERGYLGMPTVVNNVESLSAVARIMEWGAAAYRRLGTPQSPGTKLLSVAGDCRNPGVYEIEWGMRVGTLLELAGADEAAYIQFSGPSGIGVAASDKDRRIAFEDLPCGGSVMIFDHTRDLLQILSNFTEFFKRESCGVCTPCRAGNFMLSRKLDQLQRGLGREADLQEIRHWSSLMQTTSRCGLGRSSTQALIHAMDTFPEYFHERVHEKIKGEKAFPLEEALSDYQRAVDIEKR